MMENNNTKVKQGLWLSTFISVAGLLFIVFIAKIVERIINPSFDQTLLTVLSIIIAIIPPFLWLSIFYRQDRLNPEPKSFVLKTMLLGALVQKAIYAPLITFVFPDTPGVSASKNYFIYIVMLAMIQEGVKLLSVRYSVYPSKEFDEKIDGIIYGSALGLGFASMTSIEYIMTAGGAMLSNATALIVIATFSHASITGLSCYILGVSKQKEFKLLRLPLALIIATALNAITQILLDTVTRRGFRVNYIVGLIPAALVAMIVFTVLIIISSRNEKEGTQNENRTLEPKKAVLGILPVWLLLFLAVFIGFIIGHNVQKSLEFKVDNILIKYPSNWIQYNEKDDLFKAGNMKNSGGQDYVKVQKLSLKNIM